MKHILFYGSGAVNLSLMGWLKRSDLSMTVLAREASAEALRQHGAEVIYNGLISKAQPTVVTNLADVPRPDLIIIGVKSYALNETVEKILTQFDRDIPVMSVLNGVRHVDLLSSKFTNALFATICYNAVRTLPYRAEAMSRGPVVLTASKASDKTLRRAAFALFKGHVEVVQKGDARDAASNKLIINLANALMTLVGFHDHRDREIKELQQLASNLMWEGVQVMRAHGVKDLRLPGLPSWTVLTLSKTLPAFIITPIFRKKMAASSINSMAQDMQRGNETEIEDLNGHFLKMARHVDMKVPYNETVYRLFKEWAGSGAAPMLPSEVLTRVRSSRKR